MSELIIVKKLSNKKNYIDVRTKVSSGRVKAGLHHIYKNIDR